MLTNEHLERSYKLDEGKGLQSKGEEIRVLRVNGRSLQGEGKELRGEREEL